MDSSINYAQLYANAVEREIKRKEAARLANLNYRTNHADRKKLDNQVQYQKRKARLLNDSEAIQRDQ